MKKIFLMAFLAGTATLVACDPVQEEKENGQAFITADQLRECSSVSVYQENGKNINYVHVTTSAAAPVQWYNGVEYSAKPTSDFLMLVTGNQTMTVTALNPDGTTVSVEYPVNIEEISGNHPVDSHWGMLCGTGSKEWVWDETAGNVWGNGGLYSGADGNVGTWWGVSPDDVAGQIEGYSYGLNDAGTSATMTFQLAGTKILKSSGGVGTFSFDFSDAALVSNDGKTGTDADKSNLWAVGQLKATGDGILFPVQINTGTRVTQFNVNYMDNEKMILTYASPGTGAWGEATFWKFRAK